MLALYLSYIFTTNSVYADEEDALYLNKEKIKKQDIRLFFTC